MKYLPACLILILSFFASPAALADRGLHGDGLSFSVGTLWGEFDNGTPDTSLDFSADLDFFVMPYTYLTLHANHAYLDDTPTSNSSSTLNQTSLGAGVGREEPVSQSLAFYIEGSGHLGFGELEVVSGSSSATVDREGHQLRAGLGFRGKVGRDEWTLGTEIRRTEIRLENGSNQSTSTSIIAVMNGSALVRLNDRLLLGPFASIDSDEQGTAGLRLRLTDW